MELSIVVSAPDRGDGTAHLLPALAAVARELVGESFEVILLRSAASPLPADERTVALDHPPRRHGDALRSALAAARGRFIATLDGDLSHPPEVLRRLWDARHRADIVVASRYVPGGEAKLPLLRRVLSRLLNSLFQRGLSLPVHDFSSGYRLYRGDAVRAVKTHSRTHAVLPEILIRAYADGWNILEVPFTHNAMAASAPSSWLARFALEFAVAFYHLWKLRWSIFCADYDERAFRSRVWLQRYWHRRRHAICLSLAGSGRILDAGCGSSRILVDLDKAVGLDISGAKLRYMRRYGTPLVRGSVTALPFCDSSFDVVLCSQVIEHLPQADSDRALRELVRVLKPGGRLVVGTPDYSRLSWHIIERLYRIAAPWGYADEHVTHYTLKSLHQRLASLGLLLEDARYVLGCEMILALRKPADSAAAVAGARQKESTR